MPRPDKTLATQWIQQIAVKANPMQATSRSARLFYAYATTNKARKSNPKLAVTCVQHEAVQEPEVKITYMDGTSKSFPSARYRLFDMVSQTNIHCHALREKAEIAAS